MRLLCAAVVIAALVLTLVACVQATPTPTPIPTPHTQLARFLSYAPLALAEWGDVRFEDELAQMEALGQDNVRSFQDLMVGDRAKDFEFPLTFGAFPSGATSIGSPWGTFWQEEVGLDYLSVDHALRIDGEGTREMTVLEGPLDTAAIREKLVELGYEESENGYYSMPVDFVPSVSPQQRTVFPSMHSLYYLAFTDGLVITGSDTDHVRKAVEAIGGKGESLTESPGYAALANALGDVHSANILVPQEALGAFPDMETMPYGVGGDWGMLHEWGLVGFGFTRRSLETGTFSIALYYADPDAAAADAQELVRRLDTYRLISVTRGQSSWDIETERTAEVVSRYCPAETPVVESGTWGSTLTLTCETVAKGSGCMWWPLAVGYRDLGFLVPEPVIPWGL